MKILCRRHERFDLDIAADPTAQAALEAERQRERDFMLDCVDLVEGRDTPGAARAEAERARLQRLVSEAKRRALVGADPLNITGHTDFKGKQQPKKKLAADPIEHVGTIARTVSSINRLSGKNKLDSRQHAAAETYRTAFETMHSALGGAMDFSRIRAHRGGSSWSPTDAVAKASDFLKQARELLGIQATIILERVVCHGHGVEECARLIYGYPDHQKTVARDVAYVGRRLRESLSDLADLWHPVATRQRTRAFRPASSETTTGDAGLRTVPSTPYVTR